MKDQRHTELKTAYGNAWKLFTISIIFIICFSAYVFYLNYPGHDIHFNMGAKPFVPASSHYATGWYSPVKTPFGVDTTTPIEDKQ